MTGIYNKIMADELPAHGIECIILPRKEAGGRAISASTVRECIKSGDLEGLGNLVPPSTWEYFTSREAAPVIERIRQTENVVHY